MSTKVQTSGKLFGADEFAEKVLRNLRLSLAIAQPISEPEANCPRLLCVLFCLGAHQEHAELER